MNDVRVEDREVGRIERAYLFGHFDSRGGFVLVVAPTLARALVAYVMLWGGAVPTGAGKAGPLHEELRIEPRATSVRTRGLGLFWPGR